MSVVRYHYDWEFKENGNTIEPISLGMVADDGRELYIINKAAIDNFRHRAIKGELDDTDLWLQENVFKHISFEDEDRYAFGTDLADFRRQAANIVNDFMLDINWAVNSNVELWGYFGAYDHVCFAQLFGPMVNIPPGMPMYTNELMTIRRGRSEPPRPAGLQFHHALADAKYQKLIYDTWSK